MTFARSRSTTKHYWILFAARAIILGLVAMFIGKASAGVGSPIALSWIFLGVVCMMEDSYCYVGAASIISTLTSMAIEPGNLLINTLQANPTYHIEYYLAEALALTLVAFSMRRDGTRVFRNIIVTIIAVFIGFVPVNFLGNSMRFFVSEATLFMALDSYKYIAPPLVIGVVVGTLLIARARHPRTKE